jgi:hypothetical protein
MSSDIDFTPFCGNPYCFAPIKSRNGLVLSCGCFLCQKCAATFTDLCPGCKNRGVRAVSLENPPPEVGSVTCDTAQDFEKIFTALKFQIQHYKATLARMTKLISNQNLELEGLKRL